MTMMIIGEERVVPLAEMTPLEVLPNINPPPLLRVIASSSSSPSSGNFCLYDDYRSEATPCSNLCVLANGCDGYGRCFVMVLAEMDRAQ